MYLQCIRRILGQLFHGLPGVGGDTIERPWSLADSDDQTEFQLRVINAVIRPRLSKSNFMRQNVCGSTQDVA